MSFRHLSLIFFVILMTTGCDSNEKASAVATDEALEQGDEASKEDGEEPADHAHEHDEDHFHLGAHMYEISRRFSSMWFAGQKGNALMVKYQTHELEEVIEEIAEAKPMENEVDVARRLETDVESHFEDLEKHAESGDKKAFEATYRKVMNGCTVCHADTKHGFIQVKLPEYDPYPNLAY